MFLDTTNPVITSWLEQMGDVGTKTEPVSPSDPCKQEPISNITEGELDFLNASQIITGSCNDPGTYPCTTDPNCDLTESYETESELMYHSLYEEPEELKQTSCQNLLTSHDLEKLKCESADVREMLKLVIGDLISLRHTKTTESNIDKTSCKSLPGVEQIAVTNRNESNTSSITIKEEPFSAPVKQVPTETKHYQSGFVPEAPFPTTTQHSTDFEEDSTISDFALSKLIAESESQNVAPENELVDGFPVGEDLELSENWSKPKKTRSKPYSYRPVKRETSEEVVMQQLRALRDLNIRLEFDALISTLDLSTVESCLDSFKNLHEMSQLRQGKLYHRIAKGLVISTVRRWFDSDRSLGEVMKSHDILVEVAQRRNFIRVYNLYCEFNDIVHYNVTLTYVMVNFELIRNILRKGLLSSDSTTSDELYPSPEKYMQVTPSTEPGSCENVDNGSFLVPQILEKEFNHNEY